MNCSELLQNLNAYLDDELSSSDKLAAKSHLSACRSCSVVVNTCHSTIQVYRHQYHQIPSFLHRKVMDNVSRRTRPQAR